MLSKLTISFIFLFYAANRQCPAVPRFVRSGSDPQKPDLREITNLRITSDHNLHQILHITDQGDKASNLKEISSDFSDEEDLLDEGNEEKSEKGNRKEDNNEDDKEDEEQNEEEDKEEDKKEETKSDEKSPSATGAPAVEAETNEKKEEEEDSEENKDDDEEKAEKEEMDNDVLEREEFKEKNKKRKEKKAKGQIGKDAEDNDEEKKKAKGQIWSDAEDNDEEEKKAKKKKIKKVDKEEESNVDEIGGRSGGQSFSCPLEKTKSESEFCFKFMGNTPKQSGKASWWCSMNADVKKRCCACLPGYQDQVQKCVDKITTCHNPYLACREINVLQDSCCAFCTPFLKLWKSRPGGRHGIFTIPQGPCGRRKTMVMGARIIGGKNVKIEKWPWMVRVKNKCLNAFCGGSIIFRDWVLTAAHCMETKRGSMQWVRANCMEVMVGATHTSLREGGQEIAAASIHHHPGYFSRGVLHYDIALIKLSRPVTYGPKLQPICVPKKEDFGKDEICYATGYGATASGQLSEQLKETPVFKRRQCRTLFRRPELHVCTKAHDRGHSCQGDSGGPLNCRMPSDPSTYYVAGVTSMGAKKCTDTLTKSATYSRLSSGLAWLDETIKQHRYLT